MISDFFSFPYFFVSVNPTFFSLLVSSNVFFSMRLVAVAFPGISLYRGAWGESIGTPSIILNRLY